MVVRSSDGYMSRECMARAADMRHSGDIVQAFSRVVQRQHGPRRPPAAVRRRRKALATDSHKSVFFYPFYFDLTCQELVKRLRSLTLALLPVEVDPESYQNFLTNASRAHARNAESTTPQAASLHPALSRRTKMLQATLSMPCVACRSEYSKN